MDSKRIRLILGGAACVLAVYVVANVTMGSVARWVEVEQDGYLWWSEEWLQLFGAQNFEDRGQGRILLTGSSEVREGFLFDEFEAELVNFEVYNNAYSNHTLTTFLLVLEYLEMVYGPSALPEKIVLGVTPWFLLDDPTVEVSYLPRVIDRYSPFVTVDVESRPPRLVPKGRFDSMRSRYRWLKHQARRYRGAARGAMRAVVLALSPGLADRYWVRHQLVPSMYHHLPPIDQREQLEELRSVSRSSADSTGRAEVVRGEYQRLRALATRHDIDLYVVNMPQSTWMVDGYFAESYDHYKELLRSVVGDDPFLDLGRFLRDNQFYDMVHPNLEAARRISSRVAQFVHEYDNMKPTAGP